MMQQQCPEQQNFFQSLKTPKSAGGLLSHTNRPMFRLRTVSQLETDKLFWYWHLKTSSCPLAFCPALQGLQRRYSDPLQKLKILQLQLLNLAGYQKGLLPNELASFTKRFWELRKLLKWGPRQSSCRNSFCTKFGGQKTDPLTYFATNLWHSMPWRRDHW